MYTLASETITPMTFVASVESCGFVDNACNDETALFKILELSDECAQIPRFCLGHSHKVLLEAEQARYQVSLQARRGRELPRAEQTHLRAFILSCCFFACKAHSAAAQKGGRRESSDGVEEVAWMVSRGIMASKPSVTHHQHRCRPSPTPFGRVSRRRRPRGLVALLEP